MKVIIAGGSGSRLYPLIRIQLPKQLYDTVKELNPKEIVDILKKRHTSRSPLC